MNGGNQNNLSNGSKLAVFSLFILVIAAALLHTHESQASNYVNEASFQNPLIALMPGNNNENNSTSDTTENKCRKKSLKHKRHFNFDKHDFSEFRESMRELRKNLKENFASSKIIIPPINIPEINIPEIEIPEIHIPPIHIPKIDINEFSEFNSEKWDEWQKELNEKMNELDMCEFKESMKEFKMNMGKFKTEMKKFGKFMDNAKEELVKDNLIETEDDLDDFLLSEDKFEVNGKDASLELHTKYLNMYENITGNKLEGNKNVKIHY